MQTLLWLQSGADLHLWRASGWHFDGPLPGAAMSNVADFVFFFLECFNLFENSCKEEVKSESQVRGPPFERDFVRRDSGVPTSHCCVEGVRRAQHTYEACSSLLCQGQL